MSFQDFYHGKRVFVTGHTGFKGAWLCQFLLRSGALVTGYALPAPTQPNLFTLAGLENKMNSIIGDIRDFQNLKAVFDKVNPEIVFHLAAQPIVRSGYEQPVYTYETNVLGTVNLLECVRLSQTPVKSVVNVTTDKVYQNQEWIWGYRESEPLDGYDPYSSSKSCSELVTRSYRRSFFDRIEVGISTVRAGNVIGGGDFARDRIIPDCIRAIHRGIPLRLRKTNSIRPYQHVLDALFAYLIIAQQQFKDYRFSGEYNVGPDECDCITTKKLVELFQERWGSEIFLENQTEDLTYHEANFLRLDTTKLKSTFHWQSCWHIDEAIDKTVEWFRVWMTGGDIQAEMEREINIFAKKCDMLYPSNHPLREN